MSKRNLLVGTLLIVTASINFTNAGTTSLPTPTTVNFNGGFYGGIGIGAINSNIKMENEKTITQNSFSVNSPLTPTPMPTFRDSDSFAKLYSSFHEHYWKDWMMKGNKGD